MALSFIVTVRNVYPNTAALLAALSPEQAAEVGPLTNEDTLINVDVISRGTPMGDSVNVSPWIAYNRGSMTKKQVVAMIRNKATLLNDAYLLGAGGEQTLVGVELPV